MLLNYGMPLLTINDNIYTCWRPLVDRPAGVTRSRMGLGIKEHEERGGRERVGHERVVTCSL